MTAAMLWDYTNNDNVFCLIFHRNEASAKECNDDRDNGHDDDSGSSSCSDKQDSNSHDDHDEHSHGSDVKKDKTPFVLAEPVPC
jgi:hypothetical protein